MVLTHGEDLFDFSILGEEPDGEEFDLLRPFAFSLQLSGAYVDALPVVGVDYVLEGALAIVLEVFPGVAGEERNRRVAGEKNFRIVVAMVHEHSAGHVVREIRKIEAQAHPLLQGEERGVEGAPVGFAIKLRIVEREVRFICQFQIATVLLRIGGAAHGGGELDFSALGHHAVRRLHEEADVLIHQTFLLVALDDHEFIAAIADHHGTGEGEMRIDDETLQDFVAGLVAVHVIHQFEIVDVQRHDPHLFMPMGLEILLRCFLAAAAIEGAGEEIMIPLRLGGDAPSPIEGNHHGRHDAAPDAQENHPPAAPAVLGLQAQCPKDAADLPMHFHIHAAEVAAGNQYLLFPIRIKPGQFMIDAQLLETGEIHFIIEPLGRCGKRHEAPELRRISFAFIQVHRPQEDEILAAGLFIFLKEHRCQTLVLCEILCPQRQLVLHIQRPPRPGSHLLLAMQREELHALHAVGETHVATRLRLEAFHIPIMRNDPTGQAVQDAAMPVHRLLQPIQLRRPQRPEAIRLGHGKGVIQDHHPYDGGKDPQHQHRLAEVTDPFFLFFHTRIPKIKAPPRRRRTCSFTFLCEK